MRQGSRQRRRRRLPRALIAVLLLALGADLGWQVWLPGWRPALQPREVYGVDVSEHQGRVDWSVLGQAGISFGYLKATEGSTYTDSAFSTSWSAAGAAGLSRGAYHFFTFCSPGGMQARHFLDVAPADPSALAPAVDLELAGNCAGRPDVAHVRAELAVFLALVEHQTGRPTVLYLGRDFLDAYAAALPAGHPRWYRRLYRRPTAEPWAIWQASARSHLLGAAGDVDLDIARLPLP